MSVIHVIDIENRKRDMGRDEGDDRRVSHSISRESLDRSLASQKWEYENLTVFIRDKERSKLQTTHMSYGVFTLLGGVAAGLIALISKSGVDGGLSYALFGLLVVVVFGASLINVVVVKYIASFATELTLANRQLNCIRHSIHYFMFMSLEGVSPRKNFQSLKGDPFPKNNFSQYYNLIGSHVKYPFDNESLRRRYFKKDPSDKWATDKLALYRCSDLFAICSITLFTIILAFVPVALSVYGFLTKTSVIGNTASFISSVFLISIVIGVLYTTYRVIRTFYYQISEPLQTVSSEDSLS